MNDNSLKQYIAADSALAGEAQVLLFIFRSTKILIKEDVGQLSIPTSGEVSEIVPSLINRQYLGELAGSHCFCMEADDTVATPAGLMFTELRALLDQVDEEIFLLAGRAFQIINWNKMSKFCGKCGALTQTKQGELAKVCSSCDAIYYPRISPAVIVAVVRDDKILLAHNRNFRRNWYSVIAGFVEPGETFEDCVAREVMEEVGIRVKNIKYFGSQPWPFPDSLMVGFIAEYESGEIVVDGVEIDQADWYGGDNLPPRPKGTTIAGRLIEAVLGSII